MKASRALAGPLVAAALLFVGVEAVAQTAPPTAPPTASPTRRPTARPTRRPTARPTPRVTPSPSPSPTPTPEPTPQPTPQIKYVEVQETRWWPILVAFVIGGLVGRASWVWQRRLTRGRRR